MQVKQGKHLGHLRGATGVGRQDGASEPVSLAGGRIDAAIVHPVGLHLDGARARDHGPGPGVAVSDHQGAATIVPGVFVPLEVGVHLGLERDREHPLGTASADLIEREGELLASVVCSGYPEHRRTSSRRRVYAGSSDQ